MTKLIFPLLITATLGLMGCKATDYKTAAPAQEVSRMPSDLNDLEITHVAYTADNIDIRYAEIALERSTNEAVREFARTMIRDHTAVNELALALLDKLGAQPQDNFLSQKLNSDAEVIAAKLHSISSAEFDLYYASNELAYHKAVNDLVGNAFIPNIENEEVKDLFKTGLEIFQGHQVHAEMMVKQLGG